MNKRILIAEDEENLADLMADYLRKDGLEPIVIGHGLQVISCVKDKNPAVILMDLMLPGEDGLSLTKEIRRFSQVPIIMTTAKVREIDRLMGLEIGADDYVCKPYSPRELVARVHVQLRRNRPQENNNPQTLSLNRNNLSVQLKQQTIQLTVVEFNLINALFQQAGSVLSRDQLINMAYDDYRIISDRTIDSHIKKIRQKLKQVDKHEYIQSVYGLGYQFIME